MNIMEPMNLGSPPSSPASPNPNYLPAFLMGDSQPASPSPAISPGRNKTPLLKHQSGYSNTPTNLRQKLFNQSVNDFGAQTGMTPYSSPVVEKGGPPKQGLFDTMDSKPKSPILNSTMQNFNEPPMFSPNDSISRIGNDSINCSNNFNDSRLMFQNNPTFKSDRVDTLWVTIFGFTPSTSSIVLAQLANCGNIVEKKYPTQGNWVHIKFSSPHEVVKALLLNGKLISNYIMVGVMPYYNKLENNKENHDNTTMYSSPIRARSLRTSFVVPQNSSTVLSPQNVPQKSTGIVTKAMEYVFGW